MEYKERSQWEYFNFGRYRGIPLPVWSYILPLQQTETRMSNELHVENIGCTCALGYHVDMHYCRYIPIDSWITFAPYNIVILLPLHMKYVCLNLELIRWCVSS